VIAVNINGREIKLEKAVTVLEAAKSAGIIIPTLCNHVLLEKYGGCRLCVVEVEKMPRLQTACTLMVTDGMVVRTETDAIADVRRGILEFLLINHPLDCPYCDKAGECTLQDLVEKYGPTTSRFREEKRKVPESLDDPVLVRNMERCVMCTRCVRMCEGVQGASAIAVISRGGHSHIEPFSGGKFNCEYCGNCVTVCPVGAIMSRLHRHSYRPWQLVSETETICPYCGVGCTLVAQVRDDVIKRVVPRIGTGVNNGLLCSRGRFGYEFVGHEERLTTPLLRKNGALEPASWDEAISFVAGKLKEIKNAHGSDSIAGIASPRCTNEDNYVFQKFIRMAVGTNNIDSTARLGFAGAQKFIENIFGQGSTANLLPGLSNADSVFVVGGDPTAVNPVLGLQVRACARKGGAILTVGHIKGLKYFNPLEMPSSPHTETVVLECIVAALREKKGLPGSNPVLEEKIKGLNLPAADVKKACGIPEKDLSRFIDALAESSTPALVIGKGLVQSAEGNYRLFLVSAINYLINGRIYLLTERANEQGLLDMGCAPDLLPGGRPVSYAEFRRRYETAWKGEISEKAGLNLFGMIEAAENGLLKGLYVMGENPVFNMPNSKRVEKALRSTDLLVVQDIFLTETGKIADVVLPALSWAEKEGTFANMERRLQRLRKAVHRDGMDDWKIIAEISGSMGVRMNYTSAEEIFAEISRVSPLHRDLTYEEIAKGNVIYPYKGEPLRGTPGEILTRRGETSGEGEKLLLRLERPLFHSGTLSRHSAALMNIYPEAVARLHPDTASRFSLSEGDRVRLSTGLGSLDMPLVVDSSVDILSVLVTNNFEGKGAFSLMDYTLDPVTGAPLIEGTEVRIEKGVTE
jgi:NADH-quinone oxidoreductase chain G